MKSKFKSLFFWFVFFLLLIALIFFGVFVLIINDILSNKYYIDLIYNNFGIIGYLFIAIYIIFAILIFTNKFPEKIKKFENLKYIIIMALLFLAEFINIGSVMYDFD